MLTTLLRKVERLENDMLQKPEALQKCTMVGRDEGESEAHFGARVQALVAEGLFVIQLIGMWPPEHRQNPT